MAVQGGGRLPQQLTLRTALESFIEFRVETVERRSRYKLAKAEVRLHVAHTRSPRCTRAVHVAHPPPACQARLHVVDGLLLALDSMSDVIAAIRSAESAADARALLESSRFGLSATQAR